jgi:hypothetical protein
MNDYKKMNSRLCFWAIIFIYIFLPVAAFACVESLGFFEEDGFLYMRFDNQCDESKTIIVCVRMKNGSITRPGGTADPGRQVDINLGMSENIISDQTFYWTYDGSDPCE